MSSSSHTRPPGSGPRQGDSEGEGVPELPSLASWEEPVSPPAPGELPLPVRLAVQEAREATTEAERAVAAGKLNQQFDTLEAGSGSRQVADLLHELLEGGQLAGLEDTTGRTCRSAATEALLRLGFPFALEVRPEDLDHLRGLDGEQGFPWASLAAGGVLGAGIIAQWLALPDSPNSNDTGSLLPLIVLMGLSLLTLLPGLLAPERSDAKRAGLLGLLFLALIQLYLGFFGGYYGTLSGSAGLLACLLLLLPRR